jgi:phosphate transport system permease protein
VLYDQPGRVDRIFNRATMASGAAVLVIMLITGVFLALRAHTAFRVEGFSFFTRKEWNSLVNPPRIGVAGLLYGTVVVALIAEVIAVPLGVLTGHFIAEYSPLRMRKTLQAMIDLLAAIPSLLFGLWGFLFLQGQVEPLSRWFATYFGWIPFFKASPDASLTQSMFIAGIVVSMMVVPIVASISRAVFAQTPPGEKEAALALGSTRSGMVRAVVLPYGRSGIIGGAMLGLGRALGETIAVSLLLPQIPAISIHFLESGGGTIAGFIALRAGTDPFTVSGLMAAGLVLFAITLAVNLIASTVVSRSRSGVGVEL